MDISISSRQTPVTSRLEEVIRDKIGSLDRFLDGLDNAEVHFEEARNPRIADKETCEVTLQGHGHHVRCKVSAPDPYTAIDIATAKLEGQIRKLRTKLDLRHHGRGATIRTAEPDDLDLLASTGLAGTDGSAGDGTAADGEADLDSSEVDEEAGLRIVKTKRFHLGPLTPEDAALKMDLLGHGFFFFINRNTGRSAVVYRRDDGAVGLIDEAG